MLMRSGARFAAGVPLLGKNETRLAIGPGVFDPTSESFEKTKPATPGGRPL